MNERIQELAMQAFISDSVERNPRYKRSENTNIIMKDLAGFNKKFAELIVRECIDIAYEYDAPKMSGPGMIIGNRIEEHFGFNGMSMEDKKTLIKEFGSEE